MTKQEILNLVRTTAQEHYVIISECELCGSHAYCSACNHEFLSEDHAVDMIISMLEDELDD